MCACLALKVDPIIPTVPSPRMASIACSRVNIHALGRSPLAWTLTIYDERSYAAWHRAGGIFHALAYCVFLVDPKHCPISSPPLTWAHLENGLGRLWSATAKERRV